MELFIKFLNMKVHRWSIGSHIRSNSFLNKFWPIGPLAAHSYGTKYPGFATIGRDLGKNWKIIVDKKNIFYIQGESKTSFTKKLQIYQSYPKKYHVNVDLHIEQT